MKKAKGADRNSPRESRDAVPTGDASAKGDSRKIVWDREREPFGTYNHIGYVRAGAGSRLGLPEYWIFDYGVHRRADFFPQDGKREHVGDTAKLRQAKTLCRKHLKKRLKELKQSSKRRTKQRKKDG